MKILGLALILLSFNSIAASQNIVCDVDLNNMGLSKTTKIEIGNEDQYDGCTFPTNGKVLAKCQTIHGNAGGLVLSLTVVKNSGELTSYLTETVDYDHSGTYTMTGEGQKVIGEPYCVLK